jgi:putative ABC transport system permease protein
MYGRDELVLGDDQYAIVSDFDLLNTFLNPSMEQGNVLTAGDHQLSPAYKEVRYEFILMSGMSADMGAVIVPDAVVDAADSGLKCSSTLVIADYSAETAEEKADIDAKLMNALGEISDRASNGELEEGETGVRLSTKTEIKEASVGTSVITVFLVLYIGIVFVVACAAIIALKVMSDSLDSVQKFRILSRIGAGENMRKKALFVQILMNYLIPLLMAAFTAFFGLRYIKGLISAIGTVNMTSGILFTFVIMVVVYGGYFLTTYEGCKKLVKG